MTARDRVVLDASVVVKWFVTEEHSDLAHTVARAYLEPLAPDFIVAEVANVFLKKIRNNESQADILLPDLLRLQQILQLKATVPLAQQAFQIAVEHHRSAYDSLYVALALQERCPLITADQRLCNALRPAFGDMMVWLGDLPTEAV